MQRTVLVAALLLAASGAAMAAPGGYGQSGNTSGWEAATRNSNSQNYVTLYEQPNFGGRQFTYYGNTNEVYRQGFKTKSAKTLGGAWTLCDDGNRPKCQTVSGSAGNITFDVASVEKGNQGGQFSQGSQNGSGNNGQGSSGAWNGKGNPQSGWGAQNGPGGRDDRGGQGGSAGPGPGGQNYYPPGGFRPDNSNHGNFGGQGAPGGYGPGNHGSSDTRSVEYRCRGGYRLTATFDDRRGALEIRTDDEPLVVLSQVRASSGFRYESRNRKFYGYGDTATYATSRGSLSCRADN